MICTICGGQAFRSGKVIWPELAAAWQLMPHELATIDHQQGTACTTCGGSLRIMALALGIARATDASSFAHFLDNWSDSDILDIDGEGPVSTRLHKFPGHVVTSYPAVDMMKMPYDAARFDLVVHTDVLEHIADPVRGLAECRRVLRPSGRCVFTIPLLVGRQSRSRAGLAPSFHGSPANPPDCLVHTEYGADAWTHVMQAGFSEARMVALDYPAALALIGVP
jgi:SAM-dependent methyltransferase